MILNQLVDDWHAAGIAPGDTVLIHTSLKRTFTRFAEQGHNLTTQMILDSFLQAIHPAGTLLLPLFNFDFTKGVPFDIRSTPSQMGSLTEAGRLYPGAVRTGHPIYSFAVIGPQAERFRGVNNFSGYGVDSPFAMLREMDAKIASLNLYDLNSMTFYHHVEEMHNAPYRFHKKFTAPYTDFDGLTETRTYGLFVRNIEMGVLTHVNPCGELMWEAGLYSGCRPEKGYGMRVISARKMYDFISGIIISGRAKGLLYRIEGEE
jgi:aminoglycoside 3-N-acetyltransferase